jgi:hypothetical protein
MARMGREMVERMTDNPLHVYDFGKDSFIMVEHMKARLLQLEKKNLMVKNGSPVPILFEGTRVVVFNSEDWDEFLAELKP